MSVQQVQQQPISITAQVVTSTIARAASGIDSLGEEDRALLQRLSHYRDGFDDLEVSAALRRGVHLDVAAFCRRCDELEGVIGQALSVIEPHADRSALESAIQRSDEQHALSGTTAIGAVDALQAARANLKADRETYTRGR